jgi:hypothetical protein
MVYVFRISIWFYIERDFVVLLVLLKWIVNVIYCLIVSR